MKSILFVLFFSPLNIFAKDSLQKAIKEINLQAVRHHLSSNPLSKQDKEIYLYMLEQRVNDLNNEIFFSKFVPIFHSVYPILTCAGVCVAMTKVSNLYKNYNAARDGILPVAIACALIGATCVCWYKAEKEESEYNMWIEQAPIDALKIKQLLISA